MNKETHLGLMRVRELLKRFSIFIYTGNQLDDIVMMELELTDLYEEKYLETEEYAEAKMALRRAYLEAGNESSDRLTPKRGDSSR